jgi:hypothetical protein
MAHLTGSGITFNFPMDTSFLEIMVGGNDRSSTNGMVEYNREVRGKGGRWSADAGLADVDKGRL